MKIIKYNLCTKVNRGTKENPQIEEILSPVTMPWSEANEEIAKREAYGEPIIEDDGKEEIFPEPTQLDILEAKVAYLEIMTGLYEE